MATTYRQLVVMYLEKEGMMNKPSPQRIAEFKEEWGQDHEEICCCLDFDPNDDGSYEAIINTGNYFWHEESSLWLNSCASGFREDDQEVADYLRDL